MTYSSRFFPYLLLFYPLSGFSQFTPIPLSGFNQDVVAESGASALATTTIEMDAISPLNSVMFSSAFATANGLTAGLPTNGTTPHLLYMQQGTASEKMIAVAGSYGVGEDVRLMPSLAYRLGDAMVPGLGLGWRNWSFAGSYDFSIGEIGRVGPGGRSLEFSIRFAPRLAGRIDFLPCPRF